MSGMPQSWSTRTIGQVFYLLGGGTPSTSEAAYWGHGVDWITSADISGINEIRAQRKISPLGVTNSPVNIVPPGTILVVMRVGLGKVAITSTEIAFSQDLQGLIPIGQAVLPSYALQYLSDALARLKHEARGTTIPGITKKQLSDLIIPIPPINEQRRIVAKIEELFSEIDKGIESLTTAREQLKAYRQSILKAAFEGKLTADWRIENDVPEVWESIELGKCGRWQGGGTPSKAVSSYWDAGQILWVSPKDMKQRMIQNTQQKITKLGSDNSPAKLIEQKSLLFVIRSGILRRTLPIAIAPPNITINQDMNSLVPSKHMVEFLYWYCHANERVIREQCSKDGTTVESIDIARLKRVKVPIPLLTEQEQIVKKISATLGSLELVEDLLSTEMMKAANLRQSILKRAFSGQLVPQDPNDEPASMLLDRIRAAQTKAHTQKTRQSKKAGKVTE